MDEAFVIRPVRLDDLEWFYSIAHMIGTGFTSLPDDKDYIRTRISTVDKSFKEELPIKDRVYLFVREHLATNEIVGIGGIDADVGQKGVFYNYQISTVTQTCPSLNIKRTHNLLNPVNNFQQSSEMISFWVHPDWRGHAISKSISISRFLFMAQFPFWFNNMIISEIRGVCDANGVSPFWEAVGKYFFRMDFRTADALTMTFGKQFIDDLLSRHPIYLDLLPESAQKVVGVEHPEAQVARRGLESLGFSFNDHIDIFDGGPLLSAQRSQISVIAQSRPKVLAKIEEVTDGQRALVYNNRLDARMTATDVKILPSNEIIISPIAANILDVRVGKDLRYYPM